MLPHQRAAAAFDAAERKSPNHLLKTKATFWSFVLFICYLQKSGVALKKYRRAVCTSPRLLLWYWKGFSIEMKRKPRRRKCLRWTANSCKSQPQMCLYNAEELLEQLFCTLQGKWVNTSPFSSACKMNENQKYNWDRIYLEHFQIFQQQQPGKRTMQITVCLCVQTVHHDTHICKQTLTKCLNSQSWPQTLHVKVCHNLTQIAAPFCHSRNEGSVPL